MNAIRRIACGLFAATLLTGCCCHPIGESQFADCQSGCSLFASVDYDDDCGSCAGCGHSIFDRGNSSVGCTAGDVDYAAPDVAACGGLYDDPPPVVGRFHPVPTRPVFDSQFYASAGVAAFETDYDGAHCVNPANEAFAPNEAGARPTDESNVGVQGAVYIPRPEGASPVAIANQHRPQDWIFSPGAEIAKRPRVEMSARRDVR